MTFRKGDIIAYRPENLFRRDGYAEVRLSWDTGEPYGQDTFDQNGTRLTADELETGYVLFNLEDFDERPFLIAEEYASEDLFILETRKGIIKRTFLLRGALEIPEAEVAERRRQVRELNETRARGLLLSSLFDQELTASELPEMTADEVRELAETLRWVERAQKTFQTSFAHLASILASGDGNIDFQVVHTDEDHYELARARRALDTKLTALRA